MPAITSMLMVMVMVMVMCMVTGIVVPVRSRLVPMRMRTVIFSWHRICSPWIARILGLQASPGNKTAKAKAYAT